MRKDIQFREKQFIEVLRLVGSLALQCLQTGNYLFERDEVLSTIGDDAFEYGFISGHKDFRLLSDAAADVFITFPHRTIEEFFGAFYFVLSLRDGINIDSIVGPNTLCPIFMANLYFLEFSLFAIDHTFSESKHETIVTEMMIGSILDRIDMLHLDMTNICHIFPTLNWSLAVLANNKIVVKFLNKVYSKCSRARYLHMNSEDITNGVIDVVGHLFSALQYVYLTGPWWLSNGFDVPPPPVVSPTNLNLVIDYQNDLLLNKVLSYLTELKRNFCILVGLAGTEGQIDLSVYLDSRISRLHIFGKQFSTFNCKVTSGPLKQRCDKLTHISINGLQITKSCLLALSDANKANKLPNLNNVDFSECRFLENNNIISLFQSAWPNLSELNINSWFLRKVDIDILSKHEDLLPWLTSLQVYLGPKPRDGDQVPMFSGQHILKEGTVSKVLNKALTKLWLHDVRPCHFDDITGFVNSKTLPKLTHLGISTWRIIEPIAYLKVVLPILVVAEETIMQHVVLWIGTFDFSDLQRLMIHGFIRSMRLLYMFIQTPALTQLEKLDISHSSGVTGVLSILLCHSFPKLSTLILSNCELNSHDLNCLAHANLKGRLPELMLLDVSQKENLETVYDTFFFRSHQWKKTEKIDS